MRSQPSSDPGPAGESHPLHARGAGAVHEHEPSSHDVPSASSRPVQVLGVVDGRATPREDRVASEEALTIAVADAGTVVTMRTPGADLELAAGFLLGEGLARSRSDIDTLKQLSENVVGVRLRSMDPAKRALLDRASMVTSACGVCGKDKLNLELLRAQPPLPPGPVVPAAVLSGLADRLRAAQGIFERTGGLHAAALFDAAGNLEAVREDVGRHNALDKLVGLALLDGRMPLHQHIALLSGRASFELMHKCIMARVPIVCAISAPSDYAVRLAHEFHVTLVGFLRGGCCNIYTAPERVLVTAGDAR